MPARTSTLGLADGPGCVAQPNEIASSPSTVGLLAMTTTGGRVAWYGIVLIPSSKQIYSKQKATSPIILSKARQYYHTLRHLRPYQVIGRLVAPFQRRLTRIPEPPSNLRGGLKARAPFPHHDPWNSREELLSGSITFLNETERLGWLPDWKPAGRSLLWRFNLHYFHHLHLVSRDDQRALCRHWCDTFPESDPVAWHPYPTSLRIVNWCRADLSDRTIQERLYRQAAFLFRNLETFVYGNHLLENARALVMAGMYFRGQGEAEQWLQRGIQLYREQTTEQILSDGFHFERSPMYHALVLEGYLDVLNVLPERHSARPFFAATARSMTDVLASLRRPDGRLPLFNDATHEIAPSPDALLQYAKALLEKKPRRTDNFPDAGYHVRRDEGFFLVIDGGATGPDYLMAHAHADIFSYELCLHGKPFVVDSGVYGYPAGLMREYVRSTRAHNTVTIDGQDQVECWSSFRVARRWAPHDVNFQTTSAGATFEGTFSGYADQIGDDIHHRRWLNVVAKASVMSVEDAISGQGRHVVESRIHLHPTVDIIEDGPRWILERDGHRAYLDVDGVSIQTEKGWYCPRFGVRQRNTVIVIGGEMILPARLSYQISY